LNEMLRGGYPRGSSVLIEIDEYISALQCHLIIAPTDANFLTHGRGIIAIPSRGVDHNLMRRWFEDVGITRDEINGLLRVCIKEASFKPKPYILVLKGENILDDYARCMEAERELVERTGQPVLNIIGADTLIDIYGVKETISILRERATRIREMKGLGIFILKPGYPRLAKILGALADVHLKVTREYGAVLVYGVKPRTNLLCA